MAHRMLETLVTATCRCPPGAAPLLRTLPSVTIVLGPEALIRDGAPASESSRANGRGYRPLRALLGSPIAT